MSKLSFGYRIIVASVMAVSMCAIFTGCSAVRLGYNKLPELASWWLDSYIDFSDTQGPQAKAALHKLQAWHRKEELPAIAELLVQAQGRQKLEAGVCMLGIRFFRSKARHNIPDR